MSMFLMIIVLLLIVGSLVAIPVMGSAWKHRVGVNNEPSLRSTAISIVGVIGAAFFVVLVIVPHLGK